MYLKQCTLRPSTFLVSTFMWTLILSNTHAHTLSYALTFVYTHTNTHVSGARTHTNEQYLLCRPLFSEYKFQVFDVVPPVLAQKQWPGAAFKVTFDKAEVRDCLTVVSFPNVPLDVQQAPATKGKTDEIHPTIVIVPHKDFNQEERKILSSVCIAIVIVAHDELNTKNMGWLPSRAEY